MTKSNQIKKGLQTRKTENQYKELLDNSLDVIWNMNMFLKFTYISPSVFANFGYTPEEWINKRLSIFEKYKEFLLLIKKAIQAQKNHINENFVFIESSIKHKNGSTIYIEIATKVVQNKFGLPIAIMGNTRNITKRKLIEQKLIESEKRLKKSNEAKDLLLTIVSHDLVNPFNALLGYTDILENDYLKLDESERKHFVHIINNAARHNYHLTRNLLDWARIQKERIKPTIEKTNIKNIVINAYKPYSIISKRKLINVLIDIDPNLTCYADKNMLSTSLNNIISNALKFTHNKGEIIIVTKKKKGKIQIQVKDNGTGFDKAILNNLFTTDKKNSKPDTNNKKGTAFGLQITNTFMLKQNGKMLIKNNISKGSTVILELPRVDS